MYRSKLRGARSPRPTSAAEVVTISGERKDVALFCMRAKASKVPFVIALPTERLEALLAGHVAAFEFFGGVFGEVWYDNPKTAVTKILSGPYRIEHERLSALRAHYLFDSHFCTPSRGNEKGSVENLVGYVRRNALVPHTRSFARCAERTPARVVRARTATSRR